MSCYDTVCMHCPHCGRRVEERVKSGGCDLGVYSIYNCPLDVLSGVSHTQQCDKCGESFLVVIQTIVSTVAMSDSGDEADEDYDPYDDMSPDRY